MTKINELIKKIEAAERLGRFAYKDGSGCMCAVGHVFEDCGMLDLILSNPEANTKRLGGLRGLTAMFATIRGTYGLNYNDLADLQAINDNEEDPVKRKQHVIQFLRLAGEIVG